MSQKQKMNWYPPNAASVKKKTSSRKRTCLTMRKPKRTQQSGQTVSQNVANLCTKYKIVPVLSVRRKKTVLAVLYNRHRLRDHRCHIVHLVFVRQGRSEIHLSKSIAQTCRTSSIWKLRDKNFYVHFRNNRVHRK